MLMPRPHPIADLFPLLDGEAFDALVEDVRTHGLLSPIVLHEGMVLDGRNRLRACEAAGVEPAFVVFDRTDPAAWVVSQNLHRRHLDASQRAMVAARLVEHYAAKARERQRSAADATNATLGRNHETLRANLPGASDVGRARERAAAALNVSPRSVEHARAVVGTGIPDLVAGVQRGEVAVSAAAEVARLPAAEQGEIVARGESAILRAAREIRERKQRDRQQVRALVVARIAAEPAPNGCRAVYRVIVIDPPWRYEKRREDETHRARCPYPDMDTDAICALPVGQLAHEDSVLWLWTTNAFLRDAFRCLDAWGFRERTMLTWVKDRMGVGDWLRGRSEHCILAVRGRPIVTLTNQTTVLIAPLREHSRKPDEFYALVESLCPGNKLELFARSRRDGWAAWGAETDFFDAA